MLSATDMHSGTPGNQIVHREGRFAGVGGLEPYYQVWQPQGDSIASLILVHGLGEHGGRYMNLVNALVANGVTVYADDHRGHGRSAKRLLAHVNDWAEYRGDLAALVELVRGEAPGRSLFLYGHSMGGLITANYVLHQQPQLQGVVLSAPPLGDVGVSPLLRGLGRMVASIRPQMAFSNGLAPTGISRDPEAVAAYQADPLVHGRVSAQWSVEFFSAIDWSRARADRFRLPLLMVHGDADRVVPISASLSFYESVRAGDRRYITYPGGYHESHNDIHWPQLVSDVSGWLLARTGHT